MTATPTHPTSVISTQFDGDPKQEFKSFCAGNIATRELTNPRTRARLVAALLTEKGSQSLKFGRCVGACCVETLGVSLEEEGMSTYEGNARELRDAEGKIIPGVMVRNLAINGFFAKAVLVPFPTARYITSAVTAGNEQDWIERYAKSLADGVNRYLGSEK